MSCYIPDIQTATTALSIAKGPCFLSSEAMLIERVSAMKEAFSLLPTNIFYAIKANPNPALTNVLRGGDVNGIDAVSPFECEAALKLGFAPHEISFTGVNSSADEIKHVQGLGVLQTIGSLSELRQFAEMFPNADVSVRLCPYVGAGEYEAITTGQQGSKFGIWLRDIPEILAIASSANLKITGLHCHIGSGFYNAEAFSQAAEIMLKAARQFAAHPLTFIDLGGGFGVHYHIDSSPLDLTPFAKIVQTLFAKHEKETAKRLTLRLEPGKFLVSASTVLLMEVTTLKPRNGFTWVGVNSGMNHVLRPMLYGASHPILNLSRPSAPQILVNVAGNICESTDCFAKEIHLPEPQIGDVLCLAIAGGYCSSMSSVYNFRPFASEFLVRKDGSLQQTRAQYDFETFWNSLGFIV